MSADRRNNQRSLASGGDRAIAPDRASEASDSFENDSILLAPRLAFKTGGRLLRNAEHSNMSAPQAERNEPEAPPARPAPPIAKLEKIQLSRQSPLKTSSLGVSTFEDVPPVAAPSAERQEPVISKPVHPTPARSSEQRPDFGQSAMESTEQTRIEAPATHHPSIDQRALIRGARHLLGVLSAVFASCCKGGLATMARLHRFANEVLKVAVPLLRTLLTKLEFLGQKGLKKFWGIARRSQDAAKALVSLACKAAGALSLVIRQRLGKAAVTDQRSSVSEASTAAIEKRSPLQTIFESLSHRMSIMSSSRTWSSLACRPREQLLKPAVIGFAAVSTGLLLLLSGHQETAKPARGELIFPLPERPVASVSTEESANASGDGQANISPPMPTQSEGDSPIDEILDYVSAPSPKPATPKSATDALRIDDADAVYADPEAVDSVLDVIDGSLAIPEL